MKERADSRKLLPTCAEFRAIRDALALEAMQSRLPVLERDIAALYAELAPLWKAMREAGSRHEREKVYAQIEDGADMRYQQLTFERDAIVKRLGDKP